MEIVIRTENLTKTYGSNRGIRNVNLEVREGEVFGFLGPNGAGKTTTIRTLLGFLHPTSGRASIFGLDTRRDTVAIHARLGNLPGEFAFDEGLTGRQLLRFFGRLRGARDLGYAHALAERLDADLDRPIRRLSRGNKQKVGLIQAMFHCPPLLVLDEPTGGLDPLVHQEFLRIISETRAEGRTVFFSSHVLPEVERVCDRVGIIRAGELVAVEQTSELTSKALRIMTLSFAEPLDPAAFAGLPGVANVTADGPSVSFTLQGDLDPVIKLAAQHRVADLSYERPSLEEVFLTYYGERDEGGQS